MDETHLEGPDLTVGVALAELTEGVPLLGHVRGQAVVLVRRATKVSAVGATCTHWNGPMAEGLVVGDTIRCPWHHASFNLDTGAVVGAPAFDPLPSFTVIRDGDRVRIGDQRPVEVPVIPLGVPSSVVIVGAGAAGAACAVTLRREGYDGSITLIGDEVPVDRPNLSKDYLVGKVQAAWMPLRSSKFYRENRIAISTDDPVDIIDLADHAVRLRSGHVVGYGALVLAPGGEASTLPLDGAELPHVFRLRTLADADAIVARAAGRAVVIGASFIGLEVAASLRVLGVDVTVVAPEAVPLQAILGDEVGGFVRGLHESRGVVFRLGTSPVRIGATEVELSDGSTLPADLVVMGVGMEPRVTLALAAGLKVNDGIVVDEWLRTSAPDVYAAGDVARYAHNGALVRIEHWVVAMAHGQAIARTLVGRGSPYREVPFFWSQHFGVSISYVGYAERWDSVEVDGKLADGDATVVYRDGGRIRAVATVGRDLTSLQVEAAMQRGDADAVERLVAAR